jgi:DNA-binding NarL/FixJ family response regulator
MPEKDGYETAHWLKINQPTIKVMALSMYERESSIIRMLRYGVKGYLLKMAEPAELKAALDALVHKGFHYSDLVTGHLLHSIQRQDENDSNEGYHLTAREIEFLKYSCTEMTYKEIANKMFVSPRTIDGYRDALCEKLQVSSRVGLVVYAFRHGIVELDTEG